MDENTEQFTSIRFKPMSEGLGLNHFADGLPYTPASARKKASVHFDYSNPRTVLANTRPAPSPLATPQPAAPQSPQLRQAPAGTASARRMLEQFDADIPPETATMAAEEPLTAGFVRRILAYAFDVAFASGMFSAIVWASFSLNGYDLRGLLAERRGVGIFWPLTLLYVVVYMGYFLIQETTWRRTLGKAVFGIRIRSASGFATLGRAVCFFIAAIPLGVGLFWYFFDSRHRCWHDVITDSEVVLS